MASIEFNIKTNAKGAIEDLKATQANINKVTDILAKLQNQLDPSWLENDFEKLNGLIERNAKSLLDSGKAADEYEAKLKAVRAALESGMQMKGGDSTKVIAYLKELEKQAVKAQEALGNMASSVNAKSGSGGFLSNLIAKFSKTTFQVLTFRAVMKTTQLVTKAFNKTIKDGIENASQAEQVYSKLNTVFGDYRDNLSVAIELSQKLGTSTQTAASALSTVGDLLQAQGATSTSSLEMAADWVEKFQDIIAFKDINMSLEEFAQNFMSGAAGNLRNFRTFGSIVKESAVQARLMAKGLDTLTGSELELAKMTARAEIALEQQANAIGATEREWDTMLSVNRRVSEQWKEFTENIGDNVLPVLKSVKNWWASILEESNKAAKVANLYNAGKKNINVYDLNDKEDYKSFENAVIGARPETEHSWDMDPADYLANLEEVMVKFGATYEQVATAISNHPILIPLSKGQKDTILNGLAEFYKQLEADKGEERKIESTATAIHTMAEELDNFIDSMGSLTGINLTSSWEKIVGATVFDADNYIDTSDDFKTDFADSLEESIASAIKQLDFDNIEGGIDKYKNLATVLFGDDQELSSLEKWKEEIESLYVILYNRQITNKDVTDEQLQSVVALWKAANSGIETYNENLQKQKDYESALATLNGYGYGSKLGAAQLADSKMASEGMSEQKANAYATMYQQWQTAYDLAKKTGEDVSEVNSAFAKAWQDASKYFSYIEEKERKAQRAADYSSALSSLQGSGSNLAVLRTTQAYMNAGYTSDYASALANYQSNVAAANSTYEQGILNASTSEEMETVKKAWEDACEQMSLEFQDQTKDMYKTVAEQTLAGIEEIWQDVADNFVSLWGEGGTLYKAFANIGSGDATKKATGWSSLADFGMSILSQTEAMQKINSVISDTIVPILDLVLTPMLPIIELIEASIQDAFLWLTPIFVAIAKGIGGIQIVLTTIHVAVHNIRELVKKITNWKYSPKYLDLQTEMAEAIKQINENISKIETWDHKTADNTSGDYSTYQDLYKRGMLSDSNYLSLIKGTNYSSTISGGGVSLQKSGSTTYLAMNGLTINLPGITNAEQFIEYMERFKNGEVGLASRSIA